MEGRLRKVSGPRGDERGGRGGLTTLLKDVRDLEGGFRGLTVMLEGLYNLFRKSATLRTSISRLQKSSHQQTWKKV